MTEIDVVAGVPEDKWTATFLLMDKAEKLPEDALRAELAEIGLTRAVADELLGSLKVRSLSLADKLG